MAKVALLIGVSEYEPGLNPLPAAVKDVEAMRQVLVHPEMGGFAEADIAVLQNPQKYEMETAVYELFADRKKDDLLLFYFSGHGITDQLGQFYLATRSTRKNKANKLIDVTAVAASFLHQKMENSRSEQQVVILDCCFSGAFAKGMNAKSDGVVNIQTQLGGKGRAVLASSTATQYSFEHKDSGFSIYTHCLREGIEQGKADGDSDGWIAVDELHEYASDRVKTYCLENDMSPMTPEIYAVKEGYKIYLAKAPIVDAKLRYRQEAKNRLYQGKFSSINLKILKAKQVEFGLSEDEADTIRKELERPYQEYEEALTEAVKEEGYSLSKTAQKDLKDYQKILGLRDEDIAEIKERILAPKQVEYERSLKQIEQQRQEVEQLNRQQEAETRQQELERLTQQPTTTPSPTPNSQPRIKTQPFEFEVVTLSVVKKPGWFQKGIYDIKRRRGRAEFFTEELGNRVTLKMVAIPGGMFLMGSPDSEPERFDSERPQHTVTIQPFFMGKFPVTQAQWQTVASLPKVNIDLEPDPSNFKGVNRPVERVSWYEAVEFCARLSRATRRKYRLPSEAEWEYACRAGTTTTFQVGETISTDLANYCGEDRTINGRLYKGSYGDGSKGIYREQTTEVGTFSANPFGLYDMHGNVWEWCADHWHNSYKGAPTDGKVWLSKNDNNSRLLRGGSWYNNPLYCRSGSRLYNMPDMRDDNGGFRVVGVLG